MSGPASDPTERWPSQDDEETLPSSTLLQDDSSDAPAAPKQDLAKAQRASWRHSLGIGLLLATVVLWTTSSFLASTLFADNTYSKPYFVTYINAAFFAIPLVPILGRRAQDDPAQVTEVRDAVRGKIRRFIKSERLQRMAEQVPFLGSSDEEQSQHQAGEESEFRSGTEDVTEDQTGSLSLLETTKISFEFCFLWFLANYFNAACLEYTTVASSTILSSTSSIWTLLCGSFFGVEKFTLKKLIGVFASLLGVILISTVDVSGENEKDRGSFPYKSPREIAIGDAMAFFSAAMYGFYAILMKKRIGDEGRVNMPLFFGIVGIFNVLLLWPGIAFVHVTGVEPFQLPPTGRILFIIIVNSTSSLVSDFCWAYAMLLTSPLVVTVGLSLTIPLSLVGQMILDSQYSSVTYWFGAAIVFLSFIFINNEETKENAPSEATVTVRDDMEG